MIFSVDHGKAPVASRHGHNIKYLRITDSGRISHENFERGNPPLKDAGKLCQNVCIRIGKYEMIRVVDN